MTPFGLKVIISFSIIVILSFLAGVVYVESPEIRIIIRKRLSAFEQRMERFTVLLIDNDKFNPEWMDYDRYKQTEI